MSAPADLSRDKRRVAFGSILASAAMTAAKLVVGLATGSLGILSEAAHSLLDLGAASLTYVAVRLSDRPADENHPFGHGKIEAVSALAETALLFLTAIWIVWEAIERLLSEAVAIDVPWYAVAVILGSIAIDFGRSRALMKVAKATRSQALEADALHFSSDMISSAVVLVGLGSAALGYPKGDAVAAIGVALFIAHVGYGMGRRTIDVLVDAAPAGMAERACAAIDGVPGVARVARVRARPMGGEVLIEMLIQVSRVMPLDRAQDVCERVGAAIRARIPEANPLVSAEPLALDSESITDVVRLVAARHGAEIHDLGIHLLDGKPHVGFDVEVEDTLDVEAAHAFVSGVEAAIRAELGDEVAVVTHIDPRSPALLDGVRVPPEEEIRLSAEIAAIVCKVGLVQGVHAITVRRVGGDYHLSLHCLFAPRTPVRAAHDATVEVERRIRERIGGAGRIVVHAEPLGAPGFD